MNVFSVTHDLVKKISSKKHYNRKQFYEEQFNIPELIKHRKKLRDQEMIGRIILSMPEEDFCKVIKVQDCEVGKYSACICTKVMVFGDDENNGKICERFTTKVTARNCYDGNIELAKGKCEASDKAGACENILIDRSQLILKLQQERDKIKSEYMELCTLIGADVEVCLEEISIE